MNSTRRRFLVLAAGAPLAAIGLATTARAAACYIPSTLPADQKSRRRALGYVDVSPDAVRKCGACVFFTGTRPGCGTCALLGSAPVQAGGVCQSFVRPGK